MPLPRRPILLNAFDMNTPSHLTHGLWRHPRDRATDYKRLPYWLDLARTLERGLFDGLFLADVTGVYDVWGGNPEAALRHGIQVPINDPAVLVSAMASVTRHLGFGITATIAAEAPHAFARRMSTLDHLSEGRIGWNIVTGFLDSSARAQGAAAATGHDRRYDLADEFMTLVYRLWEESWDDDAVIADRARGIARQGLEQREVVAGHARQQPAAIALLFADEALSFAELNRRANRLAHRLVALGVRPDARVGIAMERSVELVVGLLAILKAGGAYLPLDPDYPAQRLAYMVDDSGIDLLLAHRATRDCIAARGGLRVLEIDSLDLGSEPESDPEVALHGENLAYVIYTSGSTGRPKGAAVRHGALHSCMAWMQRVYGLSRDDTVLHKAPFGFDVSVWEMFWPMTAGARLVVANPGDHRDPERLVQLIERHQVTTLNFVPSMLQAFLAHPGIESRTRLRYIICGGEAMPAETQKEALRRLAGASLQNLYGPTETTIHVTRWTCRDDGESLVPIGRPISDTRAWVLDAELNRVPRGVAGELYLGGVNLARGYLNRAGLSAERFVADPFGQGDRLYRTGDLVRWNAEGQIEYLGRIDHQVKIRGLRIELGEIEAQLAAQPEVRESVVVAKEGPAGATLVGYVSPRGDAPVDT
ncbi:amino acid adenylation domain-containing protein, partial [Variovorax sp. CT11-76]